MKKTLITICCLFSLNFSFAQWTQLGGDINGELESGKRGCSISLNADGGVLAVGSLNYSGVDKQSGQVKVYKTINGSWVQFGDAIIGESQFDLSGSSVKLSSDGNTLAIGAEQNSDNGENSGHVRIYRNNNGHWSQIGEDINGRAAGDRSGGSVSLSADGSVVAIGSIKGNGSNLSSGHVRVFKNYNDKWIQVGLDIKGSNVGERFGTSVSLSSDGGIVAVGASCSHSNGYYSGHVQLYENYNGVWVNLGSQINGVEKRMLSGSSVSISNNGNVVAVGAPWGNENGSFSGSVRVYIKGQYGWNQLGSAIRGEAGDKLGTSVRLNHEGNILLIGAVSASRNKGREGLAKVFQLKKGQWVQIGDDIIGRGQGDGLGCSVSLSKAGNTIAVCAPFNDDNGTDAGQVRVFTNKAISASVKVNNDSILNLLEGEWLLKSKHCGLGDGSIEVAYQDERLYKFKVLAHTKDSVKFEHYKNNKLSESGTSKLYYTNLSYSPGWFLEDIEGIVSSVSAESLTISQNSLFSDGCIENYQRKETTSSSSLNIVEEVLIYPNPASDVVKFSGLLSKSSVEVFNITGKMVYSVMIISEITSINVGKWPKGVYYAKITDRIGRVQMIKKLIVVE